MMNSRKNLVLAVMLGLALAGCKTAQKTEVTENVENEYADRGVAANVSPLADLIAKVHPSERASVLKKLNLYKDERLKTFGPLTEKNLAKFDSQERELAERMLNAIARSSEFRGIFERPALAKLLKDVDTARQLRAAAGNLGDATVAGRTSGPVIGGRPTIGQNLDRMEFLAELRQLDEFKTPEGARALDELTQSENLVRRNTGRSWFNRTNCKQIDAQGAKNYKRLIDDINAEYKKTGKMCPELEAYVLLRFQEAVLSKSGHRAYNAVMGARRCNFTPPGVLEAVEKLAQSNMNRATGKPEVPQRAPACN